MSFLNKVNREVTAEIVPAVLTKIINWLNDRMTEAEAHGITFMLEPLAAKKSIEKEFNVILNDVLYALVNTTARLKAPKGFKERLIEALPEQMRKRYGEQLTNQSM